MSGPPRRGRPVIEVLGRPWVYWSVGVLVVATSRALTQGASWWTALAIGVAAGVVTGLVVRSVRGLDTSGLRSNRAVRSVLGHLRGESGRGGSGRGGSGRVGSGDGDGDGDEGQGRESGAD